MCNEAGLAVELYYGIERTGGATITLDTCEHGGATFKISSGAQPEGGFMVAMYPEPLAHLPRTSWSPITALLALREIAAAPLVGEFLTFNPFGALGVWHDVGTGLLQLDAVEMYQDLTVALALASSRGQKAIYDLALGQDVLVP